MASDPLSQASAADGGGSFGRRSFLVAGLAGLGATAVACGCRLGAQSGDEPEDDAHSIAQEQFSVLEAQQLRGRLGVCAIDTGSGATVRYRAEERFLLCSTGKVLTVAAVLQKCSSDPDLPDSVIRYSPADVLDWAPVTSQHVASGMSVSALCEAAITVSDNTAANLLVRSLGGPASVTKFAGTLGDTATRIDRLEPDLNVTSPGDLRDTSTPAAMAADLRALAVGDALAAQARQRLVALLRANTTGDQSIRAGLPNDWIVGDKTGSGAQGESNDVAIAWPPGRAPLILAVYTSPEDRHLPAASAHAVIAQAASIAASELQAQW